MSSSKEDRPRQYPPRVRFQRLSDRHVQPENPYYYPPWNPTGDPSTVNCSYAMGLMMSCRFRKSFNMNKYREGLVDDCRPKSEDMWLCFRLRWVDDEEARIMLNEAYPWVADKTQGFRFRHVWRFRDRPPSYFDDSSLSDEDYEILREVPRVWQRGGTLLNAVTRYLFSDSSDDVHELSTREYFAHLQSLQNKREEIIAGAKSKRDALDVGGESDAGVTGLDAASPGSTAPDVGVSGVTVSSKSASLEELSSIVTDYRQQDPEVQSQLRSEAELELFGDRDSDSLERVPLPLVGGEPKQMSSSEVTAVFPEGLPQAPQSSEQVVDAPITTSQSPAQTSPKKSWAARFFSGPSPFPSKEKEFELDLKLDEDSSSSKNR